MKNVLKLSFLCLFYISVFPETYFYKIEGTPITEEEHDLLYDIKLRNQFPMSLIHGQFQENEIEAMQTEINDKVKGIGVAFIPTTLYELFFIKTCDNADFSKPKGLPSLDEYAPGNFRNVNQNLKIKLLHFKLNQTIAEYFNNKLISKEETLAELNHILQSANSCWITKYPYKDLDFNLLKRSIENEYKANEENNFLLYRATNVLEASPLKRMYIFNENQSLSFGASLFSGMVSDPSATSYMLMLQLEKGYCLPINKKLYANGLLAKMFYIPELADLASIYGDGEYFHPRTKMLNQKELVVGFDQAMTIRSTYENVKKYYETDSKNYQDIFKYISKNYILLKGANTTQDWLKFARYPLLGLTTAYAAYYIKNIGQNK